MAKLDGIRNGEPDRSARTERAAENQRRRTPWSAASGIGGGGSAEGTGTRAARTEWGRSTGLGRAEAVSGGGAAEATGGVLGSRSVGQPRISGAHGQRRASPELARAAGRVLPPASSRAAAAWAADTAAAVDPRAQQQGAIPWQVAGGRSGARKLATMRRDKMRDINRLESWLASRPRSASGPSGPAAESGKSPR
jgi:hypothetical protein